jgi:short-subunit dehydrogenase
VFLIVRINPNVVAAAAFTLGECDKPYLHVLPYNKKKAYSGKVIWLTGASSGIGATLAVDLTRAGAQVVISARRKQNLDDIAAQCAKVGLTPLVLPLDVTDNAASEKAYEEIIKQFGRVDILVLNAGRSQRYLATEMPLSETRDLMELNFISYVALTRLVVSSMLERGNGQVAAMPLLKM